ncbi:MAG: hypothetical protein F6K09_24990, partial [Merismopedia sp. SIO2A8]|nr:hypothetical protein [Merismopedia sp. SIO2A8]
LIEQTEALLQTLATLENTLETANLEAVPIHIFRSHANVILTTQPLVEELTAQLLLPFAADTTQLEAQLEAAYQRANRYSSLYRAITFGWFLLLISIGNRFVLHHQRQKLSLQQPLPSFSPHGSPATHPLTINATDIHTIAAIATQLSAIQTQPHPASSNSQSPISSASQPLTHSATHSSATRSPATHSSNPPPPTNHSPTTHLTPFLTQDGAVGDLARSLHTWGTTLHPDPMGESFAFLTARLSCLTRNRQKLMGANAATLVQQSFEQELSNYHCQLLDLQCEVDQITVLFTYPASTRLDQLVKHLKTASATILYAYFSNTMTPSFTSITSPDEIWSDAYFIATCETPSSPHPNPPLSQQVPQPPGEGGQNI